MPDRVSRRVLLAIPAALPVVTGSLGPKSALAQTASIVIMVKVGIADPTKAMRTTVQKAA